MRRSSFPVAALIAADMRSRSPVVTTTWSRPDAASSCWANNGREAPTNDVASPSIDVTDGSELEALKAHPDDATPGCVAGSDDPRMHAPISGMSPSASTTNPSERHTSTSPTTSIHSTCAVTSSRRLPGSGSRDRPADVAPTSGEPMPGRDEAPVPRLGGRTAGARRVVGSMLRGRQPRPMLGRLPWFAFERRSRALRFLVFFDMRRRYDDSNANPTGRLGTRLRPGRARTRRHRRRDPNWTGGHDPT